MLLPFPSIYYQHVGFLLTSYYSLVAFFLVALYTFFLLLRSVIGIIFIHCGVRTISSSPSFHFAAVTRNRKFNQSKARMKRCLRNESTENRYLSWRPKTFQSVFSISPFILVHPASALCMVYIPFLSIDPYLFTFLFHLIMVVTWDDQR